MKVSKAGKQREKKRLDKLATKQMKQDKMKSVLASLAAIEKSNSVRQDESNQKKLEGLRSSKNMKRKWKEARKPKDNQQEE